MKLKRIIIILPLLIFSAQWALSSNNSYDPLDTPAGIEQNRFDLTVYDSKRERPIPIRIFMPAGPGPSPTILFSHGLGGSRKGSAYLGRHWAARGYLVVYVQHPGSDSSLWEDKPRALRMEAMREAAGPENFLLRVKDIPAVLDQLELWNRTEGHALQGKMNTYRIGMSGHSFGAVTTQAVSGQTTLRGNLSFTDSRIKAAVAFSPSSPRRGNPDKAFGRVQIPWMLMTGTKDIALIGHADLESRLAVFQALPAGSKYQVVLYNAEHSAFTDRVLPGDRESRNPNHHRVILALSTAFWDAYLQNDMDAIVWLHGTGPQSVLQKKDTWQTK